MAEMVVAGCEEVREAGGASAVALSGGTFQNLLLMEQVVELLAGKDLRSTGIGESLPTMEACLWDRWCWRPWLSRARRCRSMCLGIPGRIVEILDEDLMLAKASVGGVKRNINIGLVHHEGDRVEVGDWVLIHVGFAMSKLNEAEAQSTLQALEEIGEAYEQELEELKASQIE